MATAAAIKKSTFRNLVTSVLSQKHESSDSPLLKDESLDRITNPAGVARLSSRNFSIKDLHGLKSGENDSYLHDVSTSFFDRMFSSKEELSEIREFKMAEMRNDRQAEQHNSTSSLFYYIRENQHDNIKEYLKIGEIVPLSLEIMNLMDDRDEVGANVIHVAYLYGHYPLGHMLVENFPNVAVEPYAMAFNKGNQLPYGGENILHMCIVRKSITEVTWLLNFFSDDDKQFQRTNLQKLLNSRALGSFFKLTPRSYFGETPLHFAACTNSEDMFDCVLSYVPEGVERIRYLLRRDQHGNTLLHICVLKKLKRMYLHVRAIFKEQLKNYITKDPKQAALELSAMVEPSTSAITSSRSFLNLSAITTPTHSSSTLTLSSSNVASLGDAVVGVVDLTYADRLNRFKLTPLQYDEKSEALEVKKRALLIDQQVTVKEGELLTKVLNNDGHTTLTLAAMTGDIEMLKFLLDDRMKKRYDYGPITVSLIDLEGLDQPIETSLYIMRPINKVKLHSAIEWFSLNVNSTSNRELMHDRLDPFAIPVIVDLIQTKWDKIGKIRLYRSAWFTVLTTLLITIISVVNEYQTYDTRTDQDRFVIFLYLITGFLLMVRFASTLPSLLCYGVEYWGFSGRKNAVRGAPRLDRICGDVIIVSFAAYLIFKGVAASFIPNNTQYDGKRFEQPVRYSMMICVMFSWVNLYYYMMAFENTGPLVIVMYKIMTQSLGFFLQFYILVVFGVGCALVLITNDGSYDLGGNLYFLIGVWWSLIKLTAGFKDNDPYVQFVPSGMEWSYELLRTGFSILVTILILNLLIASANDLFSKYVDLADKMYLLEQFNIMYAFDRSSRADMSFLRVVLKIMPIFHSLVQEAFKTLHAKFDLSKYAVEEKLADGTSAWYHKMETIDKSWMMSEEEHEIWTTSQIYKTSSHDTMEKSRIEVLEKTVRELLKSQKEMADQLKKLKSSDKMESEKRIASDLAQACSMLHQRSAIR